MNIDCANCDEFFPQYGAAPHECYWMRPGGFKENKIGTSVIEPLENWPDNFLAEIAPDQNIKHQLSYGLCGIYYCPSCKKGMKETRVLMSKETIKKHLENEHIPRR